jgi:hypothetical protein
MNTFFKIKIRKITFKLLFSLSFIFCISLIPINLSGQLGAIFKNVFKSSEKEIIHEAAVNSTKQISKNTRFILKNSDEVFIRLSKELKLSEGLKKNLDDFSDFLVDIGKELFINPDEQSLNSSNNNIIDELDLNHLNKDLFKLLCEKLDKDSLNNIELKLAFTGQKINNRAITKESLYKFYFIISPTFAQKEIIKLKEFYSKDKAKQEIINNLIQEKEESSEDEGSTFFDVIFNFNFIVVLIALSISYIIVKNILNVFFKK